MAFIGVTRGPEYYYVGGDYTAGSVSNNAAEAEILDYVIPADTVLNGIIIEAQVRLYNGTGGTENSIFRIKAGTDGAEVEISQLQLFIYAAETSINKYIWIKAVTNSLDWTAEQSVSITCDMSGASVNLTSYGYNLTIMGF